jgi:DNA gyrase/topoisomerase IV subunit B
MRFKEYQKGNSGIDGYEVSGKKDQTVYDVMRTLRTYMPAGIKRFKGLGELEPKEMRELCMDKKTRTVIIFKFNNYEEDMRKINVIMSTKAEAAKARRDIMMNTRIDDLDLDT